MNCGLKGKDGHPPGVATWHIGECGVCGETKEVTQPRDFGYPHFKGCESGENDAWNLRNPISDT